MTDDAHALEKAAEKLTSHLDGILSQLRLIRTSESENTTMIVGRLDELIRSIKKIERSAAQGSNPVPRRGLPYMEDEMK